VPEPPAPLGSPSVVGDGSPQSCTSEALQTAVSGGGDVSFDCGGQPVVIDISSQIQISADTIIDGGGLVTLDGGDTSRLLSVDNHLSLTDIGLTFTRGLATTTGNDQQSGGAIRGGWSGAVAVFDCQFFDNAAGDEGEEGGGAIYVPSQSTLLIVGSIFEGNRGSTGGAINNLLSGLTIVNSTFTDNESDLGGGAVYTDGASGQTGDDIGGVIDICGCRFTGNRATRQGGGAYLFAYAPDEIFVRQCVFDGNVVERLGESGALGGGLRPGNAPLRLDSSLFVDNHADVHGGGIWVDGNHLSQITNCTFTGNVAGLSGQDGGYGGAVSGGNLELLNVTIVGNHAEHSGGAIFNESGSSVSLRNSIISANTSGNDWGGGLSCRDTMAGDHDIQWPTPAGNDAPCTAGVTAADPLLEELSDNGGPTWTIPLSNGSPAIDAGEDCPAADQRGLPRSGICDVGAFEVQ